MTTKIIYLNFTLPYTPQTGDNVVLNFTKARIENASAGRATAFGSHQFSYTQFLACTGIGGLDFGLADIKNRNKYININLGIALSSFGEASLENRRRYLSPRGLDAFNAGYFYIFNNARLLAPTGWEATQHSTHDIQSTTREVFAGLGRPVSEYGEATVYLRNSYLTNMSYQADVYGDNRVEFYRRYLPLAGFTQVAYGTANISNANRSIAPNSIYKEFQSKHLVGGTRYLLALGFNEARFGTRIIPESQTVYPSGVVGDFGQVSVANRLKQILPLGIFTELHQGERWGQPHFYNLRQVIEMYYDHESELTPPAWPRWIAVHNRNRVITTFGQNTSRFTEPAIDNNARVLSAVGIAALDSPPFYNAGMVAYRIRSVHLEGVESPVISKWSVAYNAAKVLGVGGTIATNYGNASVIKTRRYFDRIGAFTSEAFGQAMIADRIRTLSFEFRYAIQPPPIQLPEVKLHTRYVDGIGQDLSQYGSHFFEIHFNRINPRWALRDFVGMPIVVNKTPQAYTHGKNTEEYGNTVVRLQWRRFSAEGTSMQLFGKAGIAYRDRTRFLTGFNALRFGNKLTVTKTGAPPYLTQSIVLSSYIEDGDGFGIRPPELQVSKPSLKQTVIYVHQSSSSMAFGEVSVMSNSIRVEPGFQGMLISKPMVSLKIRELRVSGWVDSTEPSKARLSPHTIWAVMEAPDQAQINNPATGRLHHVNSGGGERAPGEAFGLTDVMLQHRTVRVLGGISSAKYSVPSVDLHRRNLLVIGIRSLRMGWHSIPGNESLDQFDSTDGMEFGDTSIKYAPYLGPQMIKGNGLSSFTSGRTFIELKNRNLLPLGLESLRMGTKLADDKPYMWQGLRIGPRVPIVMLGTNMSLFGLTWISNKIRGLGVVGYDALLSEYQLEAFDKRMTVTRRVIPVVPRQITPVGIHSFNAGTPNMRAGVHYIRPDGNADQYRKGAF